MIPLQVVALALVGLATAPETGTPNPDAKASLAVAGIPEPDRMIGSDSHCYVAIGGERNRGHPAWVLERWTCQTTRPGVPNARGLIGHC